MGISSGSYILVPYKHYTQPAHTHFFFLFFYGWFDECYSSYLFADDQVNSVEKYETMSMTKNFEIH